MRFRTEKGRAHFPRINNLSWRSLRREKKRAKIHEENCACSNPEEGGGFLHVLDHFHSERAAFLAGAAGDTVGRVRVQGLVMLADGRRHIAQVPGQVVILMNRGYVNFLWAGQAVIAVHTSAVG